MDTHKDDATQSVLPEQPGQTAQPGPSVLKPSLRIGSILSRSFSLLGQNPGMFVGLAFLASLPTAPTIFFLPLSAAMTEVNGIVGTTIGYFAQGLMVYAVFQVMRGTAVTLGDSVAKGLAQPGNLLLTALLAGVGSTIGSAIGTAIDTAVKSGNLPPLFLLLQLGFIIIQVILLCWWAVIIPVCVAERLGPLQSMRRSMELTKGYCWPIFGLILIFTVPFLALSMVLAFTNPEEVRAFANGDNVVALIIVSVLGVPIKAFENVMAVVIYHDLWAIKNGASAGVAVVSE